MVYELTQEDIARRNKLNRERTQIRYGDAQHSRNPLSKLGAYNYPHSSIIHDISEEVKGTIGYLLFQDCMYSKNLGKQAELADYDWSSRSFLDLCKVMKYVIDYNTDNPQDPIIATNLSEFEQVLELSMSSLKHLKTKQTK